MPQIARTQRKMMKPVVLGDGDGGGRVARRGVETRISLSRHRKRRREARGRPSRAKKDGDTNATKEEKEATTKAPHDALALRWEVCAHRIVIGLEQMTRAERDQRPLDAQMVAKKCLRKNLSPTLITRAREWKALVLHNEERKVIAETILSMEVKKRELAWHLEDVLDTNKEKYKTYLVEGEMWERLAEHPPGVAVEDVLTVEETAIALLTLYEAQIKRSDIVDALEKIVPQTSKVLDEHAVRVEFPWADVPAIKSADVLSKSLSVQYWTARKLVEQYGLDFTEDFLLALNKRGPISLRANLAVNDGEDFRRVTNIVERENNDDDVLFKKVPFETEEDRLLAFTVSDAFRISPERDPHWFDGRYEIQDIGSQFIASSCRASKNDRVLDFCCGNGGKTLALAANGAFVTAHDVDQRRMKHLEANAKRAKVSHLITTVSDANELKKNGYYYDSVLVDAPCSSVGAWRRTPSSRWLAKEEDVQMFSKLQLEILFEAASIQFENRKRLATTKTTMTTTLVYATCSIFREENEDIARAFEASDIFMEMGYEPWPFKEEEEEEEEISRGYSIPRLLPHEKQLFPNLHETDGFYICRWKTTE